MPKLVLIFVASQMIPRLARNVEGHTNGNALETLTDEKFQFSKEFYEVINDVVAGNLISSPIGLQSILSMLAYGAGGATKTILRTGLHFHDNDSDQKDSLKSLIEEFNIRKPEPVEAESESDLEVEDILRQSLQISTDVELKLVNKLYVANQVIILPEYAELIKKIFNSTVEKMNFSNQRVLADTINKYCEEQTNSNINNIISADDLEVTTRAILVSTIYFNGEWETPFDKNYTYNVPFHLEDGSIKTVPTMHETTVKRYGTLQEIKSKFAEFPYKTNGISMFIVLPEEVTGLKHIQKNFAKLNLNRLLNVDNEVELHYSIPRFEIKTTIDLMQPIFKLGMGNIFENSAILKDMFNVSVGIDKAIQKAYLKVDEKGTEASLVTQLEALPLLWRRSYYFTVDRPFYYAIIKRVGGPQGSGIILFDGHITDPTKVS